jgi:hypothetical protein
LLRRIGVDPVSLVDLRFSERVEGHLAPFLDEQAIDAICQLTENGQALLRYPFDFDKIIWWRGTDFHECYATKTMAKRRLKQLPSHPPDPSPAPVAPVVAFSVSRSAIRVGATSISSTNLTAWSVAW